MFPIFSSYLDVPVLFNIYLAVTYAGNSNIETQVLSEFSLFLV